NLHDPLTLQSTISTLFAYTTLVRSKSKGIPGNPPEERTGEVDTVGTTGPGQQALDPIGAERTPSAELTKTGETRAEDVAADASDPASVIRARNRIDPRASPPLADG